MKIEIAVDSQLGNEFCDWLNIQGHDAEVGTTTANYIDGCCTSHDDDANVVMNDLWAEFSTL